MRKREEEGQGKRKREERKLEGAEKDMGNLGEENKEGESEKGIQRKRERNGRGGRKGDFSGALYCIELILHNTCFASYKLRVPPKRHTWDQGDVHGYTTWQRSVRFGLIQGSITLSNGQTSNREMNSFTVAS